MLPTARAGVANGPSALACVALLLTSKLKGSADSTSPLSRSEFQQFATWFGARRLALGGLLGREASRLLRGHADADRVQRLLRRAPDAERLWERWRRLGLWMLSERDAGFPSRLRERLGSACLPLLFGAGSREPIGQGGLCVVGSRDCTAESLDFARLIGTRAAREGIVVISSDMRGVDREVLAAALAAGGRVLCVLADGLDKAATSRRYRDGLAAGRVTLVSPFLPESHFAVANAMRAHRYQYGLSDAAIVVETRQTGGIWSAADENRKQQWVPAFVRADADAPAANSALLHLGLLPVTRAEVEQSGSVAQLLLAKTRGTAQPSASGASRARADFYSIFQTELNRLGANERCCAAGIAERLALEPQQIRAWLERARRERPASAAAVAEHCVVHPAGEYNAPSKDAPC